MTYNSVVLADSPRHYVTFDQTGTLTDSGSIGASLTVTGGVTQTTGAISGGKAETFNGTSQTITINSSYDFAAGTTWSFEAWFKTTASTGTPEIIRKDGAGRAYLLRLNTGNLEWYCNQTGILTSGKNYADGVWHHVVATYSGGTTKLYIDGTQYGTTGTGTAGSQGSVATYIGSSGGTGEWFNGTLDEVAIYSTALTQTQVTNHYNAAVNTTATPPAMTMSMSNPVPLVYGSTPVPPMTLSISTPSDIWGGNISSYSITNDADTSSGTTGVRLNVSSTSSAALRTDAFTLPADFAVYKATLNLWPVTLGGGAIEVYRINTTWSEGTGRPPLASCTDLGFSFTPTATGAYTAVDITSVVRDWLTGAQPNDGLQLATSGSNYQFVSKDDTGTFGKPFIEVWYQPGVNTTATPPAMTLSLDTVAPTVSDTSNVTNAVPAMGITLSYPGGISANPDSTATPGPMGLSMTAQDASVSVQYPALITPPPIDAGTLDTPSGVTINLTTNRINSVPPMALTLKWVGTYVESDDRYLTLVASTVDADDMWYKLNETSGTTAVDNIPGYNNGAAAGEDGTYKGTVVYSVDGPQLRKAVHFNGTDAWLEPFYQWRNGGLNFEMAVTIEFGIRTTATDGVVMAAYGPNFGSSSANWDQFGLDGNEIRMEAGQLVLYGPGGQSLKVRQFIADGQWHHVVLSIPSGAMQHGAGQWDQDIPWFVSIDGQSTLVRRFGFFASKSYGEYWMPGSFMARFGVTSTSTQVIDDTATTGYLAGDLSNVIIRMNNYIDQPTATNLYYAWSNSVVMDPPPMTLSVSTVDPFSAKGNIKKMLAIYGLPYEYASNGLPMFTWMSNLSGLKLHHFGGVTEDWPHIELASSANLNSIVYRKPKPFMTNGYMVYPMSIIGDPTHDSSGLQSTDGLVNPDAEVISSSDGTYVDDATGLPRFIDLQNDLNVPITDFDVVTTVNYPFPVMNVGGIVPGVYNNTAGPVNSGVDGYLSQHLNGVTESEWEAARDKLRDSILDAAYSGVNLWIGEWHAAMHLGFIQSVDFSDPGYWDDTFKFDSTGTIIDQHNFNQQAQDLDIVHLPGTVGGQYKTWAALGGYVSWPQVNVYRQVAATVPGLTDIPTNEQGDTVQGHSLDRFKPNGDFLAYDLIRRPGGLQVGDQILMQGIAQHVPGTVDTGENLRTLVISARPDGIVGQVVTREMDHYYGPLGVRIDNPHKGNAITIAAERGTVVRGKAIKGRAFIELMEGVGPTNGTQVIYEDRNKNRWMGLSTDSPVTTWDFDSRRYNEVKAQLSATKFRFNQDTGEFEQFQAVTNYFQYDTPSYNALPRVTWQDRGLNWLAQTPTAGAGDAENFPAPITLALDAPVPAVSQTKNPTIEVNGAMRLFNLEIRQPANYSDGSVEENPIPMELTLEMRGIGSSSTVPPMSLSVTTVDPVVHAATETVVVYLDSDATSTKLFLKEDN